MLISDSFILDALHVEESILIIAWIEIVDDEFFMAASLFSEIDALLDITMALQKWKDSQMIQIIVVFLDEVEEVFLQHLDLFLTHHLLVRHYFCVSIFLDSFCFEYGNLRKH